MSETQKEYAKLKEEIMFLQSDSMDESRILEMWAEIEQEKIQEERERVRHNQWLQEREEKKLQMERQWRPNYGMNKQLKAQKSVQEDMETETSIQQPGTSSSSPSPLLSSLLKSSQANQTPIQPSSNTARLAPTITNLLTGSSTASPISSNSPSIITQSSSNAQNNLINASVSVALGPIATINHSASPSVQIPVSQSAPTLITLLDKKPSVVAVQDPSTSEKQQLMMSISVAEGSGGKDGADSKDDEADLLADFNELINDKFDDDDLADLNSIIMNPEILEDKITEDEPLKDVDDSSQATSTDDYDKLKIKQLVEDFAAVPEVEQISAPQEERLDLTVVPPSIEESDVIQVPSEPESSNPASIEMVEPTESNDSTKPEPTVIEDKVLIISDESSSASDEKKDLASEKIESVIDDELETVTSVGDEVKDEKSEDSGKETRAFQGIQGSSENSASSEKEVKESTDVFQVDDSDEDVIFEDAKETHDESLKTEKVSEAVEPKKSQDVQEATPTKTKIVSAEVEEVTRSAGSIDSDDEVLEAKVSRSTGRKKAAESFKLDTPRGSTRSRDHSENDDKDMLPIRTRSRHSSVQAIEMKPTFNFPKEQDHSMWKGRWEDCVKELQKHKDFSSVVDNKVFQDESYKSIILSPMNMKMIQKNIESHVSTMPSDVKRDFALMCTNITMMSKKGTKFEHIVHQFIRDGMEIIDKHLDVEDAYKAYRKQIKKKN